MKTAKLLVFGAGILLTLVASPAIAQSASELLEKGIYTEETVGDLPEAIKIYEKIVAQVQANRPHAAQAQYRLAMCYRKMGNDQAATAALETLIKEFADQTEIVAKAKLLLPNAGGISLEAAPWVDGEQLQLTARLATGIDIGAFTLSARNAQLDGQDVCRMQLGRYIALNAPNMGVSRVVAKTESFLPLSSLFRHSILGTVEVDYSKDLAVVHSTGSDGKESTNDFELDGVYYDNEQGMFLFRRLPLKVGYKVDLPILAPIGSGPLKIGLEVVGKETVTVPAGEFECFKVYLAVVQQTFWYSTDEHRYLVKFEAGGISVQLNDIRTNSAGELVEYSDDQFDFTVSAPTEWYLIKREQRDDDDDGKRLDYFVLDPEAAAMTQLVGTIRSSLKEAEQASPRAWADDDITHAAEGLKDYKVRADSWRERTIGGQPAVSFVADFQLGNKAMVQYGVFSMGETNAVKLKSQMEAKWFESMHEPLDAIIDSYRTH